MDRGTALGVLEKCEVFAGVSRQELEVLLAAACVRSVRKGCALFHHGQPGGVLYVVLRGRIRIEGAGEDGNVIVHRVIGTADLLGEISLFDGGTRSASAIAHEDSDLLSISRKQSLEFLERNPKALIAVTSLLARRIRSTSDLFEDSLFLDARDRVGRMLVHLAETVGRSLRGGVVVQVTHEELGRRTGLHRVSVTNQIKYLRGSGLVDQDAGLILIRDLAKLRSLCRATSPRDPA